MLYTYLLCTYIEPGASFSDMVTIYTTLFNMNDFVL